MFIQENCSRQDDRTSCTRRVKEDATGYNDPIRSKENKTRVNTSWTRDTEGSVKQAQD